jgi:hypothetical protein
MVHPLCGPCVWTRGVFVLWCLWYLWWNYRLRCRFAGAGAAATGCGARPGLGRLRGYREVGYQDAFAVNRKVIKPGQLAGVDWPHTTVRGVPGDTRRRCLPTACIVGPGSVCVCNYTHKRRTTPLSEPHPPCITCRWPKQRPEVR